MADTQAPPAPPQTVYVPVPAPAPAVTAGWATPAGQQAEPKEPRGKRSRGVPAAPALAAAGNATALSVTSAYAAGGWPGMAAAGGAAVLAAGGAVAHRRRAVKRNADIRKALRAAGLGGGATAGWGGSGGSGRRGSGSGSAGSRRTGSGGGRTSGSPRGSASPRTSGPNRSGGSPKAGGAGSSGRLGRALDRMLGGSGKGGSDKAARKSASRDAATAKTVKAARKAAKAAAKQARKDLGLATRSSRLAAASKRGADWAWSKTAKPRAAARRLAARSARKARGLTADGLRSLRAGVWGLIRLRSWKKGGKRALAAWKAHRAKRKTPGPAAAPPAPPIASTVRRPASNTPIRSSGGPGMSGYHFVAPATEGVRAAANYNPTGMLQVIEDFAGLSEALELHAQAMRVTVENADAKFPLAPQVIDVMRQVHNLQLKAAELAKELQPASRKLHEADLARHSNPRKGPTGERMWDIASNS